MKMGRFLIIGLIVCSLLTTTGTTARGEAPLAELDSFVESVMAEWQVPGMALGIVQNGKVIYTRGFGDRDVSQDLPVTADTVFAIGSTTKAFTALAYQMLTEDGLLDWDRPVREYLPGFRMYDLFTTERITARDWALHRSGLARHDIPFLFNPDLNVTEFLGHLDSLKPYMEFRTQASYSSLGYVILGRLLEQATGRPWTDVVRDRILQPLEMQQTSFTIADLQRAPEYATQYALAEGKLIPVPYTSLEAVGPAGGMNSTLADMLKWVRFQLNNGRAGDRQLVSPPGLAQTQAPQMIRLPDLTTMSSYGLGWIAESYRGHAQVYHTGNTLGSSSLVSFLPQDGIAVVMLSNVQVNPAFAIVANYIYDRLLGLEPVDWRTQYGQMVAAQQQAMAAGKDGAAGKPGTSPSHSLASYTGDYRHPAYGTVQVRLADGKLTARYFTAAMTLEHWHFDQFRGRMTDLQPLEASFRFVTNVTGD
ncbi:MAG TPA: serine hydrolase, partial [Symbiobacteriaceae bacterium]|nr:serine hydrolase [Symbiobacteriaceae bacterium]